MELIFFRASRRSMLPKINEFKQYYVRQQELVSSRMMTLFIMVKAYEL